MKLVTIVVEPVLTEKILGELKSLGSTGATVYEVRGEGTKQLHSSEVPGQKTKIECVVPERLAGKIIAHIADNYFSNYSIIAFVMDVSVVRGEKYQR